MHTYCPYKYTGIVLKHSCNNTLLGAACISVAMETDRTGFGYPSMHAGTTSICGEDKMRCLALHVVEVYYRLTLKGDKRNIEWD